MDRRPDPPISRYLLVLTRRQFSRNRRARLRSLAIPLLYLLFGLMALNAGCGALGTSHSAPSDDAPLSAVDPAAVDSITIDLLGSKTHDGRLVADDDRFVVDAADHEQILRLFRDATVDPRPSDWRVRGTILITYKDGGRTSVTLFATGGLGAYKIGQTNYRGSSDDALTSTLSDCRQRAKLLRDIQMERIETFKDSIAHVNASKEVSIETVRDAFAKARRGKPEAFDKEVDLVFWLDEGPAVFAKGLLDKTLLRVADGDKWHEAVDTKIQEASRLLRSRELAVAVVVSEKCEAEAAHALIERVRVTSRGYVDAIFVIGREKSRSDR